MEISATAVLEKADVRLDKDGKRIAKLKLRIHELGINGLKQVEKATGVVFKTLQEGGGQFNFDVDYRETGAVAAFGPEGTRTLLYVSNVRATLELTEGELILRCDTEDTDSAAKVYRNRMGQGIGFAIYPRQQELRLGKKEAEEQPKEKGRERKKAKQGAKS